MSRETVLALGVPRERLGASSGVRVRGPITFLLGLPGRAVEKAGSLVVEKVETSQHDRALV